MKYYIIAGEASGDMHGANLIKALKEQDKEAEFQIVGGSLMEAEAGKTALIHTSQMAFMGFVEVIMNISSIARNLRKVKEDLLLARPHTVILIDFPGFNLKVAEFAKKNGITTSYYISPKIWAWNQKRVYKIKKVVDHMFCILPFEVDFYKEYDYAVDYVGNPLLDAISTYKINPNFVADNGLSPKEDIIALLPGSRKMEIERILPEMADMYHKFPSHQIVIAGAPNFDEAYYRQIIGDLPIKIVFEQTYDLLKNAVAAVVTSGTATLETAILRVPQVVVYKANPISIAIARKLIKVRFISLVNLINDYLSVHELIQGDCTASNIAAEIGQLITDPAHRASVLENYDELHEKLGDPGASARTASKIITYLREAQ